MLRVADQRAGIAPDRCVVDGVPTERAVRSTAVQVEAAHLWWCALGPLLVPAARVAGRRTEPVVLPLSHGAWRRLRRALGTAVVTGGVGLGTIVAGVVEGVPLLTACGVLVVVAAWLLRARALRRRWVGLELSADGERIVVTGAHPGFDASARDLFVRSLHR